jgi:glycosyltransferase involved in cell wall biosynthesis
MHYKEIKREITYIDIPTTGRLTLFNLITVIKNVIISVIKLKQIIKKDRIDIILSNAPRSIVIGVCLRIITGKKLACTIQAHGIKILYFFIYTLFVQKIIFVSRSLENNYPKFFQKQNNRPIIYNGFDFNTFSANITQDYLSKTYNLSKKTKKIGIIGRIEKEKGHELFIKSIPDIIKYFPDTKFFIIGGTNINQSHYPDYLKQIIKDLNIQNYLLFTGNIDNINDVIYDLDIVVQPSTIDEGFGRVLVEALAFGKPVVASKVKGYAEIIEHNVNGLLVPPNDPEAISQAVITILSDVNLAKTLADNALKAKDMYSLQNSVMLWESILDSI